MMVFRLGQFLNKGGYRIVCLRTNQSIDQLCRIYTYYRNQQFLQISVVKSPRGEIRSKKLFV
jgi:hypothetical protein